MTLIKRLRSFVDPDRMWRSRVGSVRHPHSSMQYRRLGRTNLNVSAIGFGTCQLRMVPWEQSVHTLLEGFRLGVNIVHTSPDYAGADDVVAEAIRRSAAKVIVCSNGWGSTEYFEHLFEHARAKFGKMTREGVVQLDMFGIACPEDREMLGDDVWSNTGLLAVLQKKKDEGKLANIFCTSHGSPSYIRYLIESDRFDAVMFSCNPLGHHMLSFNPPDDRGREDVAGNEALFYCAAERNVGVMLMEVLAGGLLCEPKAFPSRVEGPTSELPSAGEVLRYVLQTHPTAGCVLPGTASVEEATENATAGHNLAEVNAVEHQHVLRGVEQLKSSICTRCGNCERLCSQKLLISWLFRASTIARTDAVAFETPKEYQYFELCNPEEPIACVSCEDVTCRCPIGIDIPLELVRSHEQMLSLLASGRAPVGVSAPQSHRPYAARLVSSEYTRTTCCLIAENVGSHGWHRGEEHPTVEIQARSNDGVVLSTCGLRADVGVGAYGYFPLDPVSLVEDEIAIWFVCHHDSQSSEHLLGLIGRVV